MPKRKKKQNVILLDWKDGTSIGIINQRPVLWHYDGCPALLEGQKFTYVSEGSTFITPSESYTAVYDGWNIQKVMLNTFHGMSSHIH